MLQIPRGVTNITRGAYSITHHCSGLKLLLLIKLFDSSETFTT